MGKGKGYGKVILFGEHFTVYGTPVIASALSLIAEAEVFRIESGGWCIWDGRQESKGYKEEKKKMQIESIENILKYLNVCVEHFKLILGGDLPAISGIGATGASSVAIVRAFADEFNLELSNDDVNAAAYQAEIAYHGPKTVGIDNMVATYGGIISLTKGNTDVVRRIKLKEPVRIVIGNTGIVANTKKMLNGFAENKKRFPKKYDQLIEKASLIAERSFTSIEAFDLKNVGRLMNENHFLLREAGLSCDELNFLVNISLNEGALGAKLTGSGGGGIMVALTPSSALQERVASAIEERGFQAIRSVIGNN